MARDITKLHPFLQMLAAQLVKECHKQGLNVKVTDCVRSKAEQEDCNRRGTSSVRYPYTYHAWGLAFDVCQNDPNNAFPSDNKWWAKVGAIGKKLGLEWGGDWRSPVDRPHFQLDAYGVCTDLLRKYSSPRAFFSHADYKISTPKLSITPTSSRKKVLWLQIKLNLQGAGLVLDGVYGQATAAAVKAFWRRRTGKSCTGKLVSVNCIKLLV